MIISKKRFEAEVEKRVSDAVLKVHEQVWKDERERELHRRYDAMEQRVIALEKKNGIDHPSHFRGEYTVHPL